MAELRVRSTLDGSGFHGPLGAMRGAVRSFAGSIQGQLAAAFSVGAISAFATKVVELASKFTDMADTLKINVEWMQRFLATIRKTGGKDEDFQKFAVRLQASRQEALDNPNGTQARGFRALGISQQDISTQNAQGMMELIMKAFANGADAKLSNALLDVGGKSAAKLVLAFEQGIDEKATIISSETADALDELSDRWDELKTELISEFAPVLVSIIAAFQDFFGVIKMMQAAFGGFFGTLWAGLMKFFDALSEGNLSEAGSILRHTIKAAVREGRKETMNAAREIAENNIAREKRLEEARKRRNQQNNESPELTPTPKTGQKLRIEKDSLTSVGNFLGAGRSAIESIGQKTNQILTKHTSLLTTIAEKVGSTSRPDIQVPSS